MTISQFPDALQQEKLKKSRETTTSKIKKNRNIRATIAALREHLFEELDALQKGESEPHEAMAFAELSTKVLDTVEMEMKHAAFRETMAERKHNQKYQRLLPPPPTEAEDEREIDL